MRYKVFRVAWLIYGVSVNDTKMIEIMIRWHKSQASGQIQAGVMRKTLQYYVRSSAGLRSSEYYEFSFSIIMSSNLSVYRNLEWRYTWKCLKITYHIIQYCRVPSKERYGGDKNKTIRRRKKMRDMSCKPDLYRDHPVILLNIITSHLLQHDSLSLCPKTARWHSKFWVKFITVVWLRPQTPAMEDLKNNLIKLNIRLNTPPCREWNELDWVV